MLSWPSSTGMLRVVEYFVNLPSEKVDFQRISLFDWYAADKPTPTPPPQSVNATDGVVSHPGDPRFFWNILAQ